MIRSVRWLIFVPKVVDFSEMQKTGMAGHHFFAIIPVLAWFCDFCMNARAGKFTATGLNPVSEKHHTNGEP
jgi:hypothetical protein